MRYCEGSCRRKYVKSEGSASPCKYHRGYNSGTKGDAKVFEVCLKTNLIANLVYKAFKVMFGDIVDVQDIKYGSRESKSVIRNKDKMRNNG